MAHLETQTQPAPVRTARDLRREVQEFLNRLAAALMAGDGETVATLWETPALVIDSAGVIAVDSPQQVAAFFGAAKQQYNAQGIMATRAAILDLERIGDRIAIATVRWPHLDANGHEVASESSDYTLRRDDEGRLRIRSVLMRGIDQKTS